MKILMMLATVAAFSMGVESRKGAMTEISQKQLAHGYWLVLMASNECKNCSTVKKLLGKIAGEFYPHIKFGYLAQNETKRYGILPNSDVGKLLLFPNQGSARYIPFNENQTKAGIRFFLRYYLAENAKSQSRFDTAMQEFDRALQQRPSSAMVHLNLAILYHQQRHDLVAAAKHYDHALEDEASLPSLSQAHYMAGNTYLTLGYPEKARRHYARAVQADPALHAAHRESAIAAGMQDDPVASEAALRKAISIRPDDPDSLVDLASLLLDRYIASRAGAPPPPACT